jgi:hypothetical protein
MVVAQVASKSPVTKALVRKVGSDATFSLSVLPKENQLADGSKAASEAYISLTGLFKKSYDGGETSYVGKNTVVDEDTGKQEQFLYGIFTMRDTKPEDGMVLKSKPFIQPDGPRTPNVCTDKWKQIAVLKGMIRDGKQKYHGKDESGNMYFVNTRVTK